LKCLGRMLRMDGDEIGYLLSAVAKLRRVEWGSFDCANMPNWRS